VYFTAGGYEKKMAIFEIVMRNRENDFWELWNYEIDFGKGSWENVLKERKFYLV